MDNYRHEYKYLLNGVTSTIQQIRAAGLLLPDPHADETGGYTVRSLYFDDFADTCLRENRNGTDPRSKFRIRYYNNDLSTLRLEKKSKCRGMTSKESCPLTPEECTLLIQGQIPATDDPVKLRLFTQLQLRCLSPKVIVTYRRDPYIYPVGNVRVTFDRELTASAQTSRFLTGDYRCRPVLATGQSLLEVKWDAIMPSHIKEVLSLEQLQWTAFSKYSMCRIYQL